MIQPDIAIIGGGPAGLALGALLERNGIKFVIYERSAKDGVPRGSCLDLHKASGQVAIKEAGCFEEFKKHARWGSATTHWIWTHQGERLFAWGEGRDSPEIDREQLKQTLLTGFPEHKICWSTVVEDTEIREHGDVVLKFSDGSEASGFRLVVGADGLRSRVRHLVTSAEPIYSGIVVMTVIINIDNPFYSKLEESAGEGPMVVMGRAKEVWIQKQGSGQFRIELGWKGSKDFPADHSFSLSDIDSVKKFLLSKDQFGNHQELVRELIAVCEGPFTLWPLWYFPPEHLNWDNVPGVTLIGDAAHVTTPFVGDGVNIALEDVVLLVEKIKKYGITPKAITEYETEMFPNAIDVIERSVASGELFFHEDSPKSFIEMLHSDKPLLRFDLDQ